MTFCSSSSFGFELHVSVLMGWVDICLSLLCDSSLFFILTYFIYIHIYTNIFFPSEARCWVTRILWKMLYEGYQNEFQCSDAHLHYINLHLKILLDGLLFPKIRISEPLKLFLWEKWSYLVNTAAKCRLQRWLHFLFLGKKKGKLIPTVAVKSCCNCRSKKKKKKVKSNFFSAALALELSGHRSTK